MSRIVAADIGGTHCRFAIAEIAAGQVTGVSEPTVLRTSSHASLGDAWGEFATRHGEPLPRAAAIAIAAPVEGETVALTNNPWTLHRPSLPSILAVDRLTIVNDFAAVAHAVASLAPDHFLPFCGPERLPDEGVLTVIGPGTGLGVAQLVRAPGGCQVIATEGGHIDFAPLDAFEDRLLASLRARFGRVSAERVVSGPGLVHIHAALAASSGAPVPAVDDQMLWRLALDGADPLAATALDRFCLSLGAVAGDLALAQGASGVVIAGGLGQRLASVLPKSAFEARFVAKGRFEPRMRSLPVKILTHRQAGLYGAAAAFAAAHPTA